MPIEPAYTLKVFIGYAHEDEVLLHGLKKHLRPLKREGLIDLWHDRDITASIHSEQEIEKRLNAADCRQRVDLPG